MSKMIQVRNVPDMLHRKLKARAAEQGVSLSDLILTELERVAEQISPQELAARSLAIVHETGSDYSVAKLIREQRDGRERQLASLFANEPRGRSKRAR